MFTCEGLLQQHEWAYGSYRRLLKHCEKLSEAELASEHEGFGFPSVRDQLIHIAGAELFWLNAAQGQPWPHHEPAEFSNLVQIRPLFDEAYELTRDYLGKLTDAELTLPVRVEWAPGEGIDIAPAFMLSHVITHGFHHKGQVVAMCRLMGHPAPDTDLA